MTRKNELHSLYMQLTRLQLEKNRRGRELQGLQARVQQVAHRIGELDNRKLELQSIIRESEDAEMKQSSSSPTAPSSHFTVEY